MPQGGGTAVATAPKVSLMQAFAPDPSKAPPLEWIALVVGVVLAISGVLPWLTDSASKSYLGLDFDNVDGFGLIVLGAGLSSIVMGFVGLSRDSISLAVGQAVVGLLALVFAVIKLSAPGDGFTPAWGIYVVIVAAVALLILSLYNAFDARRKGATY